MQSKTTDDEILRQSIQTRSFCNVFQYCVKLGRAISDFWHGACDCLTYVGGLDLDDNLIYQSEADENSKEAGSRKSANRDVEIVRFWSRGAPLPCTSAISLAYDFCPNCVPETQPNIGEIVKECTRQWILRILHKLDGIYLPRMIIKHMSSLAFGISSWDSSNDIPSVFVYYKHKAKQYEVRAWRGRKPRDFHMQRHYRKGKSNPELDSRNASSFYIQLWIM